MEENKIQVVVAGPEHEVYVDTILQTIADAAKVRGTGIAKRTHEYLATKMKEAKAVIALSGDRFAGFSYIETWGNKQYVTTSGLIVHPDFRGLGVAKKIKDMTFSLARTRWPHAKIFSLTSGAAVMKMNTELGYQPVTFADLTDDEAFWRGCEGCVNVDVLHRTGWLRGLCECGCVASYGAQVLHLYGYALRSRRTSASKDSRGCNRAHQGAGQLRSEK